MLAVRLDVVSDDRHECAATRCEDMSGAAFTQLGLLSLMQEGLHRQGEEHHHNNTPPCDGSGAVKAERRWAGQ